MIEPFIYRVFYWEDLLESWQEKYFEILVGKLRRGVSKSESISIHLNTLSGRWFPQENER